MIGESFDEYSDEICGAFINIRKMNRISLWTSDASKQNDIMAIGFVLFNFFLSFKFISKLYFFINVSF